MKKQTATTSAVLAAAALVLLVGVSPAAAEYRGFPGVNCQGHAYTTARTSAMWDYHAQTNYSNTSQSDTYQFGPNYSGAVQTHNNWSSYRRTSSAFMYTLPEPSSYAIGSPRHTCDN